MATYECSKCGMSVNASCGKCETPLVNDNLKLGMEIKNSFILKDFYNYRSSENLMFGLGIDLTHSFFKNRKYIEPIKNIILNNIKSNKLVKKLSTSISDRGFF